MQQNGAKASSREQAQRMADGCLGMRVGRLHRLVSRRFDAELRPLGLTLPQLEVLASLALAEGPVRLSELAGWLGLERSTISRNVDVLTRRGLVETTGTSPTGRTIRVRTSTTGHQALADAQAAWGRAQAAVGEALGQYAVNTLDGWLHGIST